MEKLREFFEIRLFGVCSYFGEKLNFPTSHLRLFFIYSSFLTFGSPVIIYLGLATLLKLKDYIKGKVNPVRDF